MCWLAEASTPLSDASAGVRAGESRHLAGHAHGIEGIGVMGASSAALRVRSKPLSSMSRGRAVDS